MSWRETNKKRDKKQNENSLHTFDVSALKWLVCARLLRFKCIALQKIHSSPGEQTAGRYVSGPIVLVNVGKADFVTSVFLCLILDNLWRSFDVFLPTMKVVEFVDFIFWTTLVRTSTQKTEHKRIECRTWSSLANKGAKGTTSNPFTYKASPLDCVVISNRRRYGPISPVLNCRT